MESIRKLLGELRNDDFRYGLLDDGDSLLLAISPDFASSLFLSIIKDYSFFQKKRFRIEPILLDVGFPKERIEEISSYASSLGYQLKTIDCILPFTNQLFKKKGFFSHPIYTRFIKGALFDYAQENGLNKIVLSNDLTDLRTIHHLSFKEDPTFPLLPIKEIDGKRRVSLIRPFLFIEEEIILDASEKKGVPLPKRAFIDKGERFLKAKEEVLSSMIDYAGFKKRIRLEPTYLKNEELGEEKDYPYTLHRVSSAKECAQFMQFDKEGIIPHFSNNLEYYLIYQKHSPIGEVSIEWKNAHEAFIFSYYVPEDDVRIENCIIAYLLSRSSPLTLKSYLNFSFYKEKRPDESGLFVLKLRR
ncbi:MAG: hypothetical protein J6328_07395 [Bacilli bacterium]|nr:hypothetical protein [Bacilli bacterium]